MTTLKEMREDLQKFANKHKVIFEDNGEVGFGRPCVGFEKNGSYLDINPVKHAEYREGVKWEDLQVFGRDDRLRPPKKTPNAYHKHDCLAVLVQAEDWENIKSKDTNTAIRELWHWIKKIESRRVGCREV